MKESVRRLETWFIKARRPLPWRLTCDPYAIWVSEVMLQQTQVATVIPYYLNFLSRFPTVQDLADARESDVLSLWSGLGYYTRGRNLHRAAKVIVQNYSGTLPQQRNELLKIPGIGPYTAGAILSIAFDQKEAAVDGNVFRVFARFFGFKKSIDHPKNHGFFWEKAQRLLEHAGSPRLFNQALMELGATVCTKSSPKCLTCPISKTCFAYRKNLQLLLPRRKIRRKTTQVKWNICVFENTGKLFLIRNPDTDWWAGLWDFPRLKTRPKGPLFSRQRHTVTHHRIMASAYHLRCLPPAHLGKGKWVSRDKALKLPISSLSRKILFSLPEPSAK